MLTASPDFWLRRLSYALDKASTASSDRSRLAYLELARHYRSLHELSDGSRASPITVRHEPTLRTAAEARRHGFRSVHDALMGPA